MTEKIKSNLQKRLEAQGWTHLTNECPATEVKYVPVSSPRVFTGPKGVLMYAFEEFFESRAQNRGRPLTDEELRREFLNRDFKEVCIADAYDIEGKPVPKLRAIYVKR